MMIIIKFALILSIFIKCIYALDFNKDLLCQCKPFTLTGPNKNISFIANIEYLVPDDSKSNGL